MGKKRGEKVPEVNHVPKALQERPVSGNCPCTHSGHDPLTPDKPRCSTDPSGFPKRPLKGACGWRRGPRGQEQAAERNEMQLFEGWHTQWQCKHFNHWIISQAQILHVFKSKVLENRGEGFPKDSLSLTAAQSFGYFLEPSPSLTL